MEIQYRIANTDVVHKQYKVQKVLWPKSLVAIEHLPKMLWPWPYGHAHGAALVYAFLYAAAFLLVSRPHLSNFRDL